jgi:hypothetical protein
VGERRLRQDVVRDPRGELGERVRGAGRDDEQIGPRQVLVDVLALRPPREREERLFGDESMSARREELDHLLGQEEQTTP